MENYILENTYIYKDVILSYTMKQIVIRMNYQDWKHLRKIFPSYRGETMAQYLRRYIRALKKKEKK